MGDSVHIEEQDSDSKKHSSLTSESTWSTSD